MHLCLNGQKWNTVSSDRLAVIDTIIAIILIVLLIVGAFIVNRIFRRRRQLLGRTQTKGQDVHNNYGDNDNLEVDMAKSDRHSIISGFPTI
jgi:hypothetical protein